MQSVSVIPMHNLLLPVDGSWKDGLARTRLMVDSHAFRTYVKSNEQTIFWYDSSIISHDPLDREMYMEAYRQLYGGDNVKSVYGATQPPGKLATLTFLRDQYNLERMREISSYDVVILCSSGKQKALQGRQLLSSATEVCRASQFSGPFSTAASRTTILDQCTLADLSVVVVRALSLDEESPSYVWEADPTVTCIYI